MGCICGLAAILVMEQNVKTALGLAERGCDPERGHLVPEWRCRELREGDEVKPLFPGG